MKLTKRQKAIAGATSILVLWATTVRAQESTGAMRSQRQPSPAPSLQPNPSPSTLELPTSPSNPVLEIPGQLPEPALSMTLPSPFVGCWEGTIDGWDSLTPIGFLSSLFQPTQITYRFCYLPNADGRSYRFELGKVAIAAKELKQTAFENQVVWIDDRHGTGYLRNHLTVIQTSWLLFIPIRVRQDAYTEEIVVLADQNLVRMRGADLVQLNGADYLRQTFHADFQRVPDALGVKPSSSSATAPLQSETGAWPLP
jgi:hypothetical protein